jgi:hypothetical protein
MTRSYLGRELVVPFVFVLRTNNRSDFLMCSILSGKVSFSSGKHGGESQLLDADQLVS